MEETFERGADSVATKDISGGCVEVLFLSRWFIRIGINPSTIISQRVQRAANASRFSASAG